MIPPSAGVTPQTKPGVLNPASTGPANSDAVGYLRRCATPRVPPRSAFLAQGSAVTVRRGRVAFFELHGGLIFALYPRRELAKDARVPNAAASSLEFSLGYLVGSKKEADELLGKAQAAGGTITDEPHDRAWGIYSGYFKDLDGHLWEIIWNPKKTGE